jgi:hydrogenase maturation protease
MAEKVCIVGYGNPLRGDDGVGPLVVQRLRAGLGPKPWLRFYIFQQLEEGLLDDLGNASLLILVDGSAEESGEDVWWRKLEPRPSPSPFTHHMEPGMFLWLLGLARGSCPEAWLVSIPGRNFGQQQGLSPQALSLAWRAQREIEAFIKDRLQLRGSGEEFSCRAPQPLVRIRKNG